MFNDPHSLGSVSAALALGLLAARRTRFDSIRIGEVVLALFLLLLVSICYSRVAWLSAGITMLFLLYSWRPSLAFGLLGVFGCILGLVAWQADGLLAWNQRYVTRLVQFVRPDRIAGYRRGQA